MLATMIIVFTVVYGVEHLPVVKAAGRAKRAMLVGLAVFVAMSVLNLFWPYA